MRIISWIFLASLGIAIIILSIGNKEAVTFSFYPLPFAMDVPLFALANYLTLIGLDRAVVVVSGEAPDHRPCRPTRDLH